LKKQLLSTTAIAAGLAMAAPAGAQEWDMTWGGYYTAHVAFASVDSNTGALAGTDFDGVDTYGEAQISFTPSVTLDNGLTFGINVEYETRNNAAAFVDTSFMTIESERMGRFELGNTDSVGYKMIVSAPQVDGSLWINSPSLSGFIPLSAGVGGNLPWNFQQSALSSFTEVLGNEQVPRISYYSPSFSGLTLGISYAATATDTAFSAANSPGKAGNNGGVNRNVGVTDIIDIAAAYERSFNGIDLNLAARYGMAENNTGIAGTSDPDVWGVGGTIGFAGFVIGGSYGENDNGNLTPDEEGWSLGVTYDFPGPWLIGVDTYQGEWSGTGAGSGDKAEYEAYQIIGSRDLGPAIAGAPVANTSVEGTLIGTSINLSF
jgi:predicted porin